MLLRQAAKEFGWSLNYGAIALMWRVGSIIRRYVQLTYTVTLSDPCVWGGGLCLTLDPLWPRL